MHSQHAWGTPLPLEAVRIVLAAAPVRPLPGRPVSVRA
jgi:hypothetical protein